MLLYNIEYHKSSSYQPVD